MGKEIWLLKRLKVLPNVSLDVGVRMLNISRKLIEDNSNYYSANGFFNTLREIKGKCWGKHKQVLCSADN